MNAIARDAFIFKHQSRHRITFEEACEDWTELQKFLIICAESNDSLAPSTRIDRIWHEFILHTPDYREYCSSRLGAFIDHLPSEVPEVAAYERTLSQLRQRFGDINVRVWPAGSAGRCSSAACKHCRSCRSDNSSISIDR